MRGNSIVGVTAEEVTAELRSAAVWSYAFELCPDGHVASVQSISNALRHAEGFGWVKRIRNGNKAALWGLKRWSPPAASHPTSPDRAGIASTAEGERE